MSLLLNNVMAIINAYVPNSCGKLARLVCKGHEFVLLHFCLYDAQAVHQVVPSGVSLQYCEREVDSLLQDC